MGFSSGFDMQMDSASMEYPNSMGDARRTPIRDLAGTLMAIWNCSKPVIAAVNGYALGAGCEMVQVCDIKVASDRAILGEPEIRAGFGPPLLITPYSVNLAMAKEILLTGDSFNAREAARIGLVNREVPHDNLMVECEKAAKKICLLPQVGVKLTKDSVNHALEEMGFLKAVKHNLELMTQFDTSSSPEQEEFDAISREQGLRAALDWGTPALEHLTSSRLGLSSPWRAQYPETFRWASCFSHWLEIWAPDPHATTNSHTWG